MRAVELDRAAPHTFGLDRRGIGGVSPLAEAGVQTAGADDGELDSGYETSANRPPDTLPIGGVSPNCTARWDEGRILVLSCESMADMKIRIRGIFVAGISGVVLRSMPLREGAR